MSQHPYPGRHRRGGPHCPRCAEIGHVRAHPDKGCGDVGCENLHGPAEEARAAATPKGKPLTANVVQGIGYMGEVPMPYVMRQNGDMVSVRFTDQSTAAAFTFQLMTRDLEHLAQRTTKRGGTDHARTD